MTHDASVLEDPGTPSCRLSWYRAVCPCGFESGYMIGRSEALARAAVHNARPDLDQNPAPSTPDPEDR